MSVYNRGRGGDGSPNKIDVHVGNRIKLRRKMLKFSQEKLAYLLGVTFQQIQKYENGQNRVSASRLWDLGEVLQVPVSFFYADMDEETVGSSPMMMYGESGKKPYLPQVDPMEKEESLLLINALERISDARLKKALCEMLLAMGKS